MSSFRPFRYVGNYLMAGLATLPFAALYALYPKVSEHEWAATGLLIGAVIAGSVAWHVWELTRTPHPQEVEDGE